MSDEQSTKSPTAIRQARLVERRKAQGLTRVHNLFAHPDDHPAIKKHAAELTEKRLGPAPAMKAAVKKAPAKKARKGAKASQT